MVITERLMAPTPKFFRILRTIGIALASAGGALLAAPVALPAALLAVAGYISVAGAVMTAVSQVAKKDNDKPAKGSQQKKTTRKKATPASKKSEDAPVS